MSYQKQYKDEIVPALMKELDIKNPNAVPQIEKITVNMGIGSIITRTGEKKTDRFEEELSLITGQKPVIRKSRMSISNFKLRAGMPVGASVTLRKEKMYDFLQRFIEIAIPRIRDFRGFTKKGDKKGNLSIGVKEQTIFPEVGEKESNQIYGLQVCITTTANNDQEMFALMEKFNFPFKKA